MHEVRYKDRTDTVEQAVTVAAENTVHPYERARHARQDTGDKEQNAHGKRELFIPHCQNKFGEKEGRNQRFENIGDQEHEHVPHRAPENGIVQDVRKVLEPDKHLRHAVVIEKRKRKALHDGPIIEHRQQRERGD